MLELLGGRGAERMSVVGGLMAVAMELLFARHSAVINDNDKHKFLN
jgi:hypothetical protein